VIAKHRCAVDAIKYYFSDSVVSVWNSLSNDVVSADFKESILSVLFYHYRAFGEIKIHIKNVCYRFRFSLLNL